MLRKGKFGYYRLCSLSGSPSIESKRQAVSQPAWCHHLEIQKKIKVCSAFLGNYESLMTTNSVIPQGNTSVIARICICNRNRSCLEPPLPYVSATACMYPPQWRHLPYEEVIGIREVEPHEYSLNPNGVGVAHM